MNLPACVRVCVCSLLTLFLSSSISIQQMGHTAVVPVLRFTGLKGILRRLGPCSGRQLHYSLPCVPRTPKIRNPNFQLISPHSAPRAPTPTHYHTNTYAFRWFPLLYGNDTENRPELCFPPPPKGESNSPTASQVWIARRHNVASRRPIDIVDRHMKCGKGPIIINRFILHYIERAKSQERRTKNRRGQGQRSKSYLAYLRGKIRTKRVSCTTKQLKLSYGSNQAP